MRWGLLGGERLGSTRRIRTLGLAASVRAFNELAVPGLGGVWYGRQIVLALLGIHLAEMARREGRGLSNIMTANALEALAVWTAYKNNGWARNDRLPGYRKLGRQNRAQAPSFKLAGSRAFYVSQPMRIRTVDALATLRFVEAPSRRFNVYSCTKLGHAFLKEACPEASRTLSGWVSGGDLPFRRRTLVEELDPTNPIPDRAREILRDAFVSGADSDRVRRRSALNWVEVLRTRDGGHTDWQERPPEITDAHWADMRGGAAFGEVMAAAAGDAEGGSVLGRIEARMGAEGIRRLPLAEATIGSLRPALSVLRLRAAAFLHAGHDPSPGRAASRFCEECTQAEDGALLGSLIARDGRILRLAEDAILAGPAFRGQPVDAFVVEAEADLNGGDAGDETLDEVPTGATPPLPEGISVRIRALVSLADDLRT
jgi:hypothetical protein